MWTDNHVEINYLLFSSSIDVFCFGHFVVLRDQDINNFLFNAQASQISVSYLWKRIITMVVSVYSPHLHLISMDHILLKEIKWSNTKPCCKLCKMQVKTIPCIIFTIPSKQLVMLMLTCSLQCWLVIFYFSGHFLLLYLLTILRCDISPL